MNNNESDKYIKKLEERIMELEEKMGMLLACKLPNPQYPYWNILLSLNVSSEERTKIEYVLNILSDRICEDELEISDSAREIFPSKLFEKSKPTSSEMYDILKEVTGKSGKAIFNILVAMYNQRMFPVLFKNLLFKA